MQCLVFKTHFEREFGNQEPGNFFFICANISGDAVLKSTPGIGSFVELQIGMAQNIHGLQGNGILARRKGFQLFHRLGEFAGEMIAGTQLKALNRIEHDA